MSDTYGLSFIGWLPCTKNPRAPNPQLLVQFTRELGGSLEDWLCVEAMGTQGVPLLKGSRTLKLWAVYKAPPASKEAGKPRTSPILRLPQESYKPSIDPTMPAQMTSVTTISASLRRSCLFLWWQCGHPRGLGGAEGYGNFPRFRSLFGYPVNIHSRISQGILGR